MDVGRSTNIHSARARAKEALVVQCHRKNESGSNYETVLSMIGMYKPS